MPERREQGSQEASALAALFALRRQGGQPGEPPRVGFATLGNVPEVPGSPSSVPEVPGSPSSVPEVPGSPSSVPEGVRRGRSLLARMLDLQGSPPLGYSRILPDKRADQREALQSVRQVQGAAETGGESTAQTPPEGRGDSSAPDDLPTGEDAPASRTGAGKTDSLKRTIGDYTEGGRDSAPVISTPKRQDSAGGAGAAGDTSEGEAEQPPAGDSLQGTIWADVFAGVPEVPVVVGFVPREALADGRLYPNRGPVEEPRESGSGLSAAEADVLLNKAIDQFGEKKDK